jgi:hypothetical protein
MGSRTCQSPKDSEIFHRREETGGEISRYLGAGALGSFPRENKNLCEVTKSGLNLDCWIWKGCMEAICTIQRIITPGDIKGG